MNSAENLCGLHAKHYYMCRRERDAQVFSAIKRWEQEYLASSVKEPAAREAYIKQVEEERAQLDAEYAKTPITIGNKHRRWRMQADLEQLKWRVDYLRAAVATQN